ncbi:type II toxin-antitoxin system Phd/YefM family antitoxin [Adlercreutzia sp. ZJ473]|uniref:type II toxin-antitoxin system Phd/YefM family antitoxin n=1 Tax=Adlercreutzia sp. ZJ473 TaxID=2722822 RepID=UPI0015580CAA|nr:type II toxin-antitoxin system Phd/YefM family antitoxin [Adlercreutzia sp. ZJ473]
MVVVTNGKLAFSRDRIVSATHASKNFGECRSRAKHEPIFVTDRNASVETVIMGYDEYEAMALELERLRVEKLHAEAAARLAEVDADPKGAVIPLREVLGEEGYRDFLAINADDVPDEELFA